MEFVTMAAIQLAIAAIWFMVGKEVGKAQGIKEGAK